MLAWIKQNIRPILISSITLLIMFLVWFFFYVLSLNKQIESSLEEKRFNQTLEFYAAPESFFTLQKISIRQISDSFLQSYPHGKTESKDPTLCLNTAKIKTPIDSCIYFQIPKEELSSGTYIIGLLDDQIQFIYSIDQKKLSFQIYLKPLLFAQYHNEKPILKRKIEISDTPPLCLNSILAIEDNDFLEHKGFNLKSIARAFIKNIQEGRRAQGGSTITQQLVKNYFLSHEKTFSRKFKELLMAILLETRFHKDQILQAYINEIYMGQNATFQVRGFGAASEHYFRKPIEDLNLSECALMAAIINSPGKYNPTRNPENAKNRRELVLKKLFENNIINEIEMQNANEEPLPRFEAEKLEDPAPYFMDAALMQLAQLGISKEQGLRIYTTMDLHAQKQAKKAVEYGIQRAKDLYKERLPKEHKDLQGLLISANPVNGHVVALVGGTSYRLYPYNRALFSHRQVGSTMKAFVYLSALDMLSKEGTPYTPLSPLEDSRFTIHYEGQSWKPKNYKNKYYGTIPMFFALKNSLNVATAKLATDNGLQPIIDIAHAFGIQSKMEAVPSLSLGAFELYPWELLQAYLSIARMGSFLPITYINHIDDLEGNLIYEHISEEKQVHSPQKVAVLIGMMKQTINNGTGHLSRLLGFKAPAAGKTGTTSDSKDAWFAGFTPHLVSVSWVGFDNNTEHGLTGASGALPIWTEFMKNYGSQFPETDFQWPENTYEIDIPPFQLRSMGIPAEDAEKMGEIQLILEK